MAKTFYDYINEIKISPNGKSAREPISNALEAANSNIGRCEFIFDAEGNKLGPHDFVLYERFYSEYARRIKQGIL